MIAVAEKGYTTLELSVSSVGGHSSMPPVPQTPIGILANAIARLEDNQMAPRLDSIDVMFGFLAAEFPLPLRLVAANTGLFAPILYKILESKPTTNAIARTVTSPTMLEGSTKDNVLPRKAKVSRSHCGGTRYPFVVSRVALSLVSHPFL